MFRNLKFSYIVALVPLLAAAGFVMLIFSSVMMGQKTENLMTDIQNGYIPSLETSRNLEDLLGRIQRGLQDAVAAEDEESLDRVNETKAEFIAQLKSARANPVRDGQRAEKLESMFGEYYVIASEASRKMIRHESGEDLVNVLQSMTKKYNAVRTAVQDETKFDRARMDSAFVDAVKAGKNATRAAVLISAVLLFLIGLASYFVYRLTQGTMDEVNEIGIRAQELAAGDLSRDALEIRGRNEIAELRTNVNAMADALRKQVGSIKKAAGNVLLYSREVTAATSQLAVAADQEAAAIAETTSTAEEVKQTGQAASDRAKAIVENSEKSVEVSSQGVTAVNSSVSDIRSLRDDVESIVGSVDGLRAKLSEVGEIIETVNGIAEQSNLLAVNASIEAAKAGEFGRGFSVVAQEVKSLAEQSKSATSKVSNTLNGVSRAIENVVTLAKKGRERSETSVLNIENTGGVISQLEEVISVSAQSARDIAINANEQLIGLEQIAMAMNSTNESATNNLTISKQLENRGKELSSTAVALEQLVASYKLP